MHFRNLLLVSGRTMKVALQLLAGAAIVYAAALGLTPVARWNCEQGARTACGDQQKARVTYTGNALSGTCRIKCDPSNRDERSQR